MKRTKIQITEEFVKFSTRYIKKEIKGNSTLIKKEGKNKKKIFINPDIKVFSQGNILLDFKFLSVETQES